MDNIQSPKETFNAELYAIKLLFSINIPLGILYILFYGISYPLSLVNIYLWKLIIDEITFVYNGSANTKQLWLILGIYISINMVKVCITKINTNIIGVKIKNSADKILDTRIMRKISELDVSFYDDPQNRNMIETAQLSQKRISGAMTYLIGGILNIITFIFGLIMFITLNPLMAIIYLITCIPAMLIYYNNEDKMNKNSINAVPENRKKNYYRKILTDVYTAKEVRLYNMSGYLKTIYNDLWTNIRKERIKVFNKSARLSYISLIINSIGNIFMVFYSVYLIINSQMTIGTFSMFIALASQTSTQFIKLLTSIPIHYSIVIPHIIKYEKFIEYKNTIIDKGSEHIGGTPEIEFCDVCFHYPNSQENVINRLNLKIKAGKKIALIGVNGAGKSTIIKLLLRFYEPQSGKILIDGKNINEYTFDELHGLFSICFQNIQEYSMTMRENIAISDIDRVNNTDSIKDAARASGADKIYETFTEGIDSEMTRQFNDKGYELSGGQWQKVGIARAFFRNSRFVILDEPSSALDLEAEDLIFSSFKELCRDKGGILISHRLSSIMMVDEVVLLKKGQVIEQGTHSELMEKNDEYAKLYKMQADKYLKKPEVSDIAQDY